MARPTRRRAKRHAVTAVRVRNDPFFWSRGPIGCLLIHGLTSSPYEMRFLGERLRDGGYTVCAIRLAGHCSSPEDLAGCCRQDWYQSAEEGLAKLRAQCSAVVAVGLSLGSLLVLRLAREHANDISAVVLLSPALVLRNPWVARISAMLGPLLPLLPSEIYWPKGESDIADREARKRHPAYRRLAVKTVAEFVQLQQEVRSILSDVHQPALAIQARQDHVIGRENLVILQRKLPNLMGTVILPASYHVITVDVEKDRVAEEILRFIERSAQKPRTPYDPLVKGRCSVCGNMRVARRNSEFVK